MAMRTIAVLVVLALIGVEAGWRDIRGGLPLACGICGGGERDESTDVENPLNTFKSSAGETWTCDYLQKTLQDTIPSEKGSDRMCGIARCAVPHTCCKQRNPICDTRDLNPSCDLCGVKGVHSTMKGETVKGNLGNMNCQGLSDAMKAKTISGNLCKPATLDPYRFACCNANPGSNTGGDNTGGGNTASTKRPTKRPTNQATQPTKFPTKRPTNQATRPTPKANRQKDKKISGGSRGGAAAKARALDGEESTTSGSVGISSGLMGILVALVGLCIAR